MHVECIQNCITIAWNAIPTISTATDIAHAYNINEKRNKHIWHKNSEFSKLIGRNGWKVSFTNTGHKKEKLSCRLDKNCYTAIAVNCL